MELKPILKKAKYRKDHENNIRIIRKESLFDTLQRVVKTDQNFNRKALKEASDLEKRWVEIVGNQLALLTRVMASTTGNLTITAKNSVVIQELKLQESQILKKFKEGPPVFIFKKIIFKVKV